MATGICKTKRDAILLAIKQLGVDADVDLVVKRMRVLYRYESSGILYSSDYTYVKAIQLELKRQAGLAPKRIQKPKPRKSMTREQLHTAYWRLMPAFTDGTPATEKLLIEFGL